MGLGDFLADLGRGTAVGQVAQAFGGRNINQRAHDMFINQELPQFAETITRAQTRAEIEKAGAALIGTAMKRGVPPAGVKNLMDMLVGPALQNLQRGEVESFLKDYGPQPGQPRPEGVEGPLTPSGNFIDPTAGKPLDLAGAVRLNQAFGGNAATVDNLVRAPSQIVAQEAEARMREESQRKTAQEIADLQAKQRAIEGLPEKPIADTGVSPRALGQIGGLGQFVTQSIPQRGDPLDPDRRALMAAQTKAALARAGEADRGGRGSQMMQDFVRQGGDPSDIDGFMNYAERRSGATARGTETVTEGADPKRDRQAKIILDQQVEEAGIDKLPPDKQAVAIKKMAADLGYEIEGNPQVGKTGGMLGFGGETTVTGITGWKRKPTTRTTTRTPAGGGKSDNDPLGIRPKRK